MVIVPNPDLKPEKSRSIELGLRGRMDRLSLDLAVFSGRFSNLIVDNVLVSGTGVAGGRWQVAGGRLGLPFGYGQARGVNSTTGQPLNSIDPAQLSLGLDCVTPAWDLALQLRHRAAKKESDIDSPSLVKAPNKQFTLPSSTTLDLSAQWRIRKDLRLTASIVNLTDRKHWQWSDVQGLAASSAVTDAYTQPRRHGKVSLVADF